MNQVYTYSNEYYESKSDVAIVLGAGISNGELSPIFIDLMDCDMQNTSETILIDENICFYTLKEIEQALANKGWSGSVTPNLNSIKDYLINNHGNNGSLHEYFDLYRNSY